MKILMLSWEYPPRIIGGISRVVYDLAQHLSKSGNEVHVITCWENGTEEFEAGNNVFVHRVKTSYTNSNNIVEWAMQLNFSMIEYGINFLNKTKIDIIHAHDWLVAYSARVLRKAFCLPLITTIHATEWGRNNGIHNEMQKSIHSIENWLVNESDKVIVNSCYMKNEIKAIFNGNEDKITIINNGVDLKKFDDVYVAPEFRQNYAAPNEKIVFFVGRLVNEKGVQTLIDAIPKIIRNYNDVKFVIAGQGPCFHSLIEQGKRLNILNRIYFTGFISEEVLLKLYKCSDIAVFPSMYEPFGIVALEGMVAGIPVVVSDVGGFDEIVCHREDGMKFYCGNSNSLADCILELLKNEGLSQRMGEIGLQKVHRLYNWNNITKTILSEYQDVISQYNCSNKNYDFI